MTTFTSVARWLLPRWLYGDGEDEGSLAVNALMTLVDASAQRLHDGVIQRAPTHASNEALALLGKDRAIQRGRSETSEHYAARLTRWRWPYGHRCRGSAWALLDQISEYWGRIECLTIDRNGNRFAVGSDGSILHYTGAPFVWDTITGWSRFWVILRSEGFSETPDVGNPELWGGAFGEPGHCVGLVGMSPDDVRAMRRLVYGDHPWRPAGTRPEWIIVSLDGTVPAPNVTWGAWSRNSGGEQIKTRSSAHRYIAFDPSRNVAAGNPDSFPEFSLPGSGSFAPADADVFPATITTYSGKVIVGNPSLFPTTIPLIDDGSITQ